MKKLFLLLLAGSVRITGLACPTCELQQPRLLRGITHGRGPEGMWDYLILFSALVIFALTLYYSVKWLIRPGETSGAHIKNFILDVK